MDDEELRPDQEQNPERCAYKSALEMLMNIHVSLFINSLMLYFQSLDLF
jgi:hypothetical protein